MNAVVCARLGLEVARDDLIIGIHLDSENRDGLLLNLDPGRVERGGAAGVAGFSRRRPRQSGKRAHRRVLKSLAGSID